jgi:putative sterol carrier protein
MATTTKTPPEAAAPREGDFRRAPGLEGLSGRLRVEVAGKGAVVLEVKDGHARFVPADGDAAATASFDSEETLRAFQRGQLNPVVAALRGHLEVKGDMDFAIRTILGLQVAHPFADVKVG